MYRWKSCDVVMQVLQVLMDCRLEKVSMWTQPFRSRAVGAPTENAKSSLSFIIKT